MEDNEFVSFKGSWNETYLGGGVNGEECDVYSSEKPDDKARCKKTISKVDNDWNNENKKFFNFKPSKKIMKLIRDVHQNLLRKFLKNILICMSS